MANNGLNPGGRKVGEWDEWAVWVVKTTEEVVESNKKMALELVKLDAIVTDLIEIKGRLGKSEDIVAGILRNNDRLIQELKDYKEHRVSTCPQVIDIDQLKKDVNENKASKKWVMRTILIVGSVLASIWVIVQMVLKLIESAPVTV